MLSVGRVQTPTLALIVSRHHEIANFVPQDSWELRTSYRDVIFTATGDRFADEAKADEAAARIASEPFTVDSVTQKKGKLIMYNVVIPHIVLKMLFTECTNPILRKLCRSDKNSSEKNISSAVK